ncbi:hypothetical protein Mapa_012499 [Marchantia paleacea]|nr:hypothetical protein Mapa_012499 [Marchantia paleacea]
MRKLEGDPWDVYETILLEPINRMEASKLFFARLDAQFNKVNQFYYHKEKEFVEQAQILEKQMQALVDMRKILEESQETSIHDLSGTSKEKLNGLDHSLDLTLTRLQSMPSLDLEAGELDLALQTTGKLRGSSAAKAEEGNASVKHDPRHKSEPSVGSAGDAENGSSSQATFGPQMIMRMRVPITTPGTTISAISQTLWEDILKQGGRSDSNGESQISVTKKKLQRAEKMLRTAFIEYYRGLNLLKSYSSLNMVAFAKILKKFDKVSGHRASAIYLKVVETSYFNTSDKVTDNLPDVSLPRISVQVVEYTNAVYLHGSRTYSHANSVSRHVTPELSDY